MRISFLLEIEYIAVFQHLWPVDSGKILKVYHTKPVLQNLNNMGESFEIPVLYKDRELLFPARLLSLGYVYKFQVNVFGQELLFEQDDNGEYRALADPSNLDDAKKTDVELLKAIAASIESILK